MLPRRSRIGRIYRRITRRQPNRKAQWNQISSLRHAGGIGYPKTRPRPAVLTRDEETQPQTPLVEEWAEPAPYADEKPEQPGERKEKGLFSSRTSTAAMVSLMLLFLGCAYAAFAGFVQFQNMTLARWGCWGAVICIAAAGAGLRLATTPRWRMWGTRLATASIVSMGALFVVLVSKGFGA
jgi:hypothetical protein